jgi:hypothetical protein
MVEEPPGGADQGWDPIAGESDPDDKGESEEARERDVVEDDAAGE